MALQPFVGPWPLFQFGWAPEPVWMTWRRENSWPYRDSKSDPSVVQPVASRYTDWAIPAPTHLHLVPRSRMVELYLHFTIYLYGIMLNLLGTGTALPYKYNPQHFFSERDCIRVLITEIETKSHTHTKQVKLSINVCLQRCKIANEALWKFVCFTVHRVLWLKSLTSRVGPLVERFLKCLQSKAESAPQQVALACSLMNSPAPHQRTTALERTA
jgi:hypothetical protein